MYIKNFAPNLFLREEEDCLTINFDNQIGGFEKKLFLNPQSVLYDDHKKSRTINVNKESKILITVDQGGRTGHFTSAEIYIKNRDGLFLLSDFQTVEPVNNLRQTGCYKLVEFIADKLKEKYGIDWEYKITIDTLEKQKKFNIAMVMIISLWVAIIIAFLIKRHN